jgi:hypothetical protein
MLLQPVPRRRKDPWKSMLISWPEEAIEWHRRHGYSSPLRAAWATAAAREGRPVFVKILPTWR